MFDSLGIWASCCHSEEKKIFYEWSTSQQDFGCGYLQPGVWELLTPSMLPRSQSRSKHCPEYLLLKLNNSLTNEGTSSTQPTLNLQQSHFKSCLKHTEFLIRLFFLYAGRTAKGAFVGNWSPMQVLMCC